jgi:hypothetical protein
MTEKKYDILPPFRTVQRGGKIGTGLIPGCTIEEWRANWPKALQELIDRMTPEERAEFEKNLSESKRKKK